MQFWSRASGEHFCEVILKLNHVVVQEMSFKDISYQELWQLFCSAERINLCNLVEAITRNCYNYNVKLS